MNTTTVPTRLLKTTLALALLTLMSVTAAQGVATATPPLPTQRPVPPIVQQWADAWNKADAGGMAKLFTDDGVYQDFAFEARFQGKANVAGWVTLTVDAIPDARAVILDAFQAGDRVAVQWVFTGTTRRLGTMASTGKSFLVPVTSVFFLKGGRIQMVADYYNRAEVFQQLGLPSDAWALPRP
ncbi:ester cyclase [Deinococcus aestuarii]|uniref:ester cyclase n=1 Tax=Deinococcus aestuarii TaxID=2774531 RepID=UPI001C0DB77F|nr:nuclear transport factor 2 family protein [Deinococcus aestuarii]